MSAPGTLNDDDQGRFGTALEQLVRTYYGEKAKYALAVFVSRANGVSVMTTSDAPTPAVMASMFELAAMSQQRAGSVRATVVDTGQETPQ